MKILLCNLLSVLDCMSILMYPRFDSKHSESLVVHHYITALNIPRQLVGKRTNYGSIVLLQPWTSQKKQACAPPASTTPVQDWQGPRLYRICIRWRSRFRWPRQLHRRQRGPRAYCAGERTFGLCGFDRTSESGASCSKGLRNQGLFGQRRVNDRRWTCWTRLSFH